MRVSCRPLVCGRGRLFVRGDICDVTAVRSAMRGVQAIVHFAAESHVDRSIASSAEFVRTNVEGTRVLLAVAQELRVQKFVHLSTDEVYSTLGQEGYFTEETALAPNSPYSASKAGPDLSARAYHETYGLPVVITRCSNNYGPYQFPEKLIPLMIIHALEGQPLPVYGKKPAPLWPGSWFSITGSVGNKTLDFIERQSCHFGNLLHAVSHFKQTLCKSKPFLIAAFLSTFLPALLDALLFAFLPRLHGSSSQLGVDLHQSLFNGVHHSLKHVVHPPLKVFLFLRREPFRAHSQEQRDHICLFCPIRYSVYRVQTAPQNLFARDPLMSHVQHKREFDSIFWNPPTFVQMRFNA